MRTEDNNQINERNYCSINLFELFLYFLEFASFFENYFGETTKALFRAHSPQPDSTNQDFSMNLIRDRDTVNWLSQCFL